ncbi:hypothetical protein C7Y72_11230 [Paraconexibacter algicola]|uniref:Uncharacterized protein n=1 Tax=Paraconexibacter algicola TaxID=2133960 RepID=A0A2T4ULS7_9ACTN|nr:hypothetical protein C7Y72_11230 [Paraconexibacter algicola]
MTVAEAVEAVKDNAYVQRVATDDELRDNARVAFEAARDAYDRVSKAKKGKVTKTLTGDKQLHHSLQEAAAALKDVGSALKEPAPVQKGKAKVAKAKKQGGGGRKLVVLLVGAGLALALSSDLRDKVLDLLFGAEEEFDYTSSTAPSTPAPSPAAA